MNRKPKGSEDPLNRWYFSGGLEDCQNRWLFPINQSVGIIIRQMNTAMPPSSLANNFAARSYFPARIGIVFSECWSPVAYAQDVIASHCAGYAHLLAYLLVCEALGSKFFGFVLVAHTSGPGLCSTVTSSKRNVTDNSIHWVCIPSLSSVGCGFVEPPKSVRLHITGDFPVIVDTLPPA